jgi:replicative DNA helicase
MATNPVYHNNVPKNFITSSKVNSDEIERLIISAFVSVGKIALKRYVGIIKEHWFQDQVYKRIFRVLEEMFNEGLEVEETILLQRLRELPGWDTLDGDNRFQALLEGGIKVDNVDNYFTILAEKYRNRKLQATISKIWKRVNHDISRVVDSDSTVKIASDLIGELRAISSEGVIEKPSTIGEIALVAEAKRIELAKLQQRYTGICTGLSQLDEMTLGLQNSDLVVVAARPSMGKTAFLVSAARMAFELNPKNHVHIQSDEMSSVGIVDRFLSQYSGVNLAKMRAPAGLTEKENDALLKATKEFNDKKIYISDKPINIDQMIIEWFRAKDRDELDIAFFDYLQIACRRQAYENGTELRHEIGKATVKLKWAAKEMNVPIVALSQVGRSVENREDHRPNMGDLAEAGAIEQDADLVIFLYRDWVYNKESDRGKIEILLEKQRNGPVGMALAGFEEKTARFFDLKLSKQSEMDIERGKQLTKHFKRT